MQTTCDNTTIGLNLAKNIFYCTELNRNMRAIRQAKLRRSQVLGHISRLDVFKVRCVAMEACGGAHFWGRKFQEQGLQVRLLPPSWVKAYVVSNKTDANDSVAIAEASCGIGQVGGATGAEDADPVVQLDPLTCRNGGW